MGNVLLIVAGYLLILAGFALIDIAMCLWFLELTAVVLGFALIWRGLYGLL